MRLVRMRVGRILHEKRDARACVGPLKSKMDSPHECCGGHVCTIVSRISCVLYE